MTDTTIDIIDVRNPIKRQFGAAKKPTTSRLRRWTIGTLAGVVGLTAMPKPAEAFVFVPFLVGGVVGYIFGKTEAPPSAYSYVYYPPQRVYPAPNPYEQFSPANFTRQATASGPPITQPTTQDDTAALERQKAQADAAAKQTEENAKRLEKATQDAAEQQKALEDGANAVIKKVDAAADKANDAADKANAAAQAAKDATAALNNANSHQIDGRWGLLGLFGLAGGLLTLFLLRRRQLPPGPPQPQPQPPPHPRVPPVFVPPANHGGGFGPGNNPPPGGGNPPAGQGGGTPIARAPLTRQQMEDISHFLEYDLAYQVNADYPNQTIRAEKQGAGGMSSLEVRSDRIQVSGGNSLQMIEGNIRAGLLAGQKLWGNDIAIDLAANSDAQFLQTAINIASQIGINITNQAAVEQQIQQAVRPAAQSGPGPRVQPVPVVP